MLTFAEANGIAMRGHTLAWHRQLAPWLTNGNWTAEEARALLVEHINTVVGHYKGRIGVWDVVNEAVNDSGALRPSFYARAIGPDYIALAFRTAAAADPQAQLYYNDYNIEGINQKSDSVYKMVKALRAAGVPIHGVGFQGHFIVDDLPPAESMRANFARFADLGLKIQFTEVDIRMRLPATAELVESQAEDYRTVFEVCTQTPDCNAVVMWGVTDKDSWIPQTFRGMGDALLFNLRLEPKPAYFAVHNFLSGK
jgi:endo-1,4-beta-xylanase